MATKPQFLGYTALLGDPIAHPSKWERTKQALWESNLAAPIRGIYGLMNADPYTLYTDEGAAGQQAAADSFDVAGGVQVGSGMVPAEANSLRMGIKAYHGSPHSFDKFSMDKIGTGEGAQAYGHGLYFAENEGVAKGYRDTLSGKSASAADRTALQGKDHLVAAAKSFRDNGYGPDETIAEIAKTYKVDPDLARAAYEKANPGSMYEVSINADPNAFLDWDKPLSADAPQAVKDAFNKVANSDPALKEQFHKAFREQQPGSIYYSILNDHAKTGDLVKNQSFATDKLREAGIPGIKYLDAGSRNPITVADIERAEFDLKQIKTRRSLKPHEVSQAEVDKAQQKLDYVKSQFEQPQSRNYVVFDDKLISIVRKYGIAGASAMLGYDVMTNANKAQAAELNKANAQFHGSNMGRSGW